MAPRALVVALLILLAGCVAPAAVPVEPAVSAAPPLPAALETGTGCRSFCEPSVAVDAEGRWFVLGDALAVSEDDGATFAPVRLPPSPVPGAFQTDSYIAAAPDGTLWYSALIATCAVVSCAALLLAGIQVASTADAGATWSSTFLSLPSHAGAAGADRQWLSFGPDGTVCVTFQYVGPVLPVGSLGGGQVRASCSTDGGATFPPFVSASGPGARYVINGRPAFDAQGRLFVPFFHASQGLVVSVSEDKGRTFEMRAVDATGAWFPALAVTPSGVLHLVWSDEGTLRHATSPDQGRTWTEPSTLAEGAVSSPWAEARGEEMVAAWFVRRSDEANDLMLSDAAGTRVVAAALEDSQFREAATDHAHLTLDAAGRALVVYGDLAAKETRLAVVTPS